MPSSTCAASVKKAVRKKNASVGSVPSVASVGSVAPNTFGAEYLKVAGRHLVQYNSSAYALFIANVGD
jgi:hypothetical protein